MIGTIITREIICSEIPKTGNEKRVIYGIPML